VEQLHPTPLLAQFQLIPNWAESIFDIEDNTLISEIQERHQISKDSKVFIFCGGDNKLKGWFLLNRAFKKISQKNLLNITVIVTGGSRREDEVHSEKVRVIYAGVLEPKILSAYYRLAEYGLFPSLGGYEHAPVTLIEMIKCNILPIASDVGGIKEMLGENYSFLIDQPHSVETWVNNIEKMIALTDEEKCRLLSYLNKSMKKYKKRDFKMLFSDIVNNG
jgi:glycosyltransferase involved in cell wall biosynthesis